MELVEGPEHLETDALKTNGADVLPVNGLVCLLTVVLVYFPVLMKINCQVLSVDVPFT